jgi:LETM1-like protein
MLTAAGARHSFGVILRRHRRDLPTLAAISGKIPNAKSQTCLDAAVLSLKFGGRRTPELRCSIREIMGVSSELDSLGNVFAASMKDPSRFLPSTFSSNLKRNSISNSLLNNSICTRSSTAYYGVSQRQFAFFSTELKPVEDDEKNETSPVSASKVGKPSNATSTTSASRPIPSRSIGKTQVPTPPSAPVVEANPLQRLKETTPRSIVRKGLDMTIGIFQTVITFIVKLPVNIFYYMTHPAELKASWQRLKEFANEEAHHYWMGTKLLWADIQTSRKLLRKTLSGSSLTRRERKQLLRTVSDLFRLIPFSMFVLIPFMEFALPLALRIFPNMLPSTYQDSLKAEENMKRELKSRIAMAQFFQE